MRPPTIEALMSVIATLPLTEEVQQGLFLQVSKVEKELVKKDFIINRTLKDKEIATNLLNASLDTLEETNSKLSQKNEEIQEKNSALNEQKQMLEASSLTLKQNLHDLQVSYESLEQFSNIASHDLKTPLRSIASYAQLLQRKHRQHLNEEGLLFLGFIVEGAKHMNEVICDLLEYSRTSFKNQSKSAIDLNEILETVKHNLKEDIAATGATIKYEQLPVIDVYESGILQLFQNMVSNSLKFSSDQKPIININFEKQTTHTLFSISDNGIGIEEPYQNKIFQPFQRLDHNYPGMGMGLAICKKIVQHHHGEIWVKSNIGKGATFFFTLVD